MAVRFVMEGFVINGLLSERKLSDRDSDSAAEGSGGERHSCFNKSQMSAVTALALEGSI